VFNVFADLGLPNADQELLKARLTLQIYRVIKQRGLTALGQDVRITVHPTRKERGEMSVALI
jgi:hypothetical protein